MNNKYKIIAKEPLLRLGLVIETECSEKYLLPVINTLINKIRELNKEGRDIEKLMKEVKPMAPSVAEEFKGKVSNYSAEEIFHYINNKNTATLRELADLLAQGHSMNYIMSHDKSKLIGGSRIKDR